MSHFDSEFYVCVLQMVFYNYIYLKCSKPPKQIIKYSYKRIDHNSLYSLQQHPIPKCSVQQTNLRTKKISTCYIKLREIKLTAERNKKTKENLTIYHFAIDFLSFKCQPI